MKGFYGTDGKIRLFRPELNMERFYKSAIRMCLPGFDKEELLNCIVELVRLEKDWIPSEHGKSMYIRPTLISLDVCFMTYAFLHLNFNIYFAHTV